MKKWILCIVTILLLCSSVTKTDDLESAIEAYKKNNYAQALELLYPLVAQGITDAQNILVGCMKKAKV